MKKKYVYIVGIVLGVMFFGFTLFSFLNEDVEKKDARVIPKKLIIHNVKEIKAQEKKYLPGQTFEITKETEIIPKIKISTAEEKNKILEDAIKEQLQERIDLLYKTCKKIDTKKGIQAEFKKMQYKDAFLANMHGNTLYGSNDTVDIYERSIVLEEIQKVGRHGGGFIVSNVAPEGTKRYILVKKLDIEDLFIGVDSYFPERL
jgi:hypothetical protein